MSTGNIVDLRNSSPRAPGATLPLTAAASVHPADGSIEGAAALHAGVEGLVDSHDPRHPIHIPVDAQSPAHVRGVGPDPLASPDTEDLFGISARRRSPLTSF